MIIKITLTAKEIADTLDKLQASVGNVRCVQSIVAHLRNGDIKSAMIIRKLEGDKTRNYPAIESFLLKTFGCRLHCQIDCCDDLCKKFAEYNKNELKR